MFEESPRGSVVALEEGEPPSARQRSCPRRGLGRVAVDRQQLFDVRAPLGELAADLEEAPEGASEPKTKLDLAPRVEPRQGFAEIVVVIA